VQLPPEPDGGWQLEVHAADDHHVATWPASQLPETASAVSMPFVGGSPFTWHATFTAGPTHLHVHGSEPALGSEEHRSLRIDFGAARPQRYRVVGLSLALLRHVKVTRSPASFDLPGRAEVPVAADGTFTLVPMPDATLHLAHVELEAEQHGDEVWLRPREPLLGVGLLDGDEAVNSGLYDATGTQLADLAPVHVIAAAKTRGARIGPDLRRAQSVDGPDLDPAADLVMLAWSASDAARCGTCRVLVEGQAPAGDAPRWQIEAAATTATFGTVSQAGASGVTFELPIDVAFDLRWRLADRTLPIVKARRLTAGEVVEVTTAWPQCTTWTGHVVGWSELPPAERWSWLAWGERTPHGDGRTQLMNTAGNATLHLLLEEPFPSRWSLGWGPHHVPAIAEVVDAAAHQFCVRIAGPVRWVKLRAEAAGNWLLAAAGDDPRRVPAVCGSRDNLMRIPVAEGTDLHGVLSTHWPGSRALAWWTLPRAATEMTVVAAPGRWIEVRPRTESPMRTLMLVGPAGQRSLGTMAESVQPAPLWIPDGTRELRVFYESGATREHVMPTGGATAIEID
jgi:hypothetical protein